jgi:hypothetical protein
VIWRGFGFAHGEGSFDRMVKAIAFSTVLAAACLPPLAAAADCTCRAFGQDIELGGSACLATSDGPRYAVCGMVLNNPSWQFSDTPCVPGQPAQVSSRHEGSILRGYVRASHAGRVTVSGR